LVTEYGYGVVATVGALTVIVAALAWFFIDGSILKSAIIAAALLVLLFTLWFFRDPERITPQGDALVISPADGEVVLIKPVQEDEYLKEEGTQISIFMSPFNVHVNRTPIEGTVKKIAYFPGKFFSAHLDKASRDNEHNAVWLENAQGQKLCVVQIAGLIARRIICYVREDQRVLRGQRFGVICFGSRLDVYMPVEADLSVSVGDKVRAGTVVLGFMETR